MRRVCLLVMLLFSVFTVFGDEALAETKGKELPFVAPLEKVADAITGPVAKALAVVGIFVAGAGLIFGGDMNGFFRAACTVVLVVSIVIGAANVLDAVGLKAATISPVTADE